MPYRIIKTGLTLFLSVLFTANVVMPYDVLAHSTLRPRATSSYGPTLFEHISSSGTLGKASSGGENILYGNARSNRTASGHAAFVRQDGASAMLTFPVWAEDLARERSRFQETMGELRTSLQLTHERGVDDTTESSSVYAEAGRILEKHIKQIVHYIDAATKNLPQNTDNPVLDQNPVTIFMDLLNHDLNTYQELKEDLSHKATLLLHKLMQSGPAAGGNLVTYEDPDNPDDTEKQKLKMLACDEHKRFVAILNRETASLQSQEAAQDRTIDVALKKISAMFSLNRQTHIPQLKLLVEASVALYVAGDGAESTRVAGQAQDALFHALDNMQNASQHEFASMPTTQAQNIAWSDSERLLKSFEEGLSVAQSALADAWGEFKNVIAPALNAYTKTGLDARMKRINDNMATIHDAAVGMNNAINAKAAMAPFLLALTDPSISFTALDLEQANVPAHVMLLKGDQYLTCKNMIAEPIGADAAPGQIHFRESLNDMVRAIEHLSHLVQADTLRTHKLQTSKRPLVVCLPALIDPSQFSSLAKIYNIVAVVTTQGTLTEHLPLVAGGLGIPYARITSDNVDLRSMVSDGQKLIVNASTQQGQSEIILHPNAEDVHKAQIEKYRQQLLDAYYRTHANDPVRTSWYFDTTHPVTLSVSVLANAASNEEVKHAGEANADGIGLFRSEFLDSFESTGSEAHVERLKSASDAASPPYRTLLFYDMRVERLEALSEADFNPGNPVLWRLPDLKWGEKGTAFLRLLPEEQRGENFEDNKSLIRADRLMLEMEALLDALLVMRSQNSTIRLQPMFPEVNHPDQLRWFFDTIMPAAVANYKSQLAHELKRDSLSGTEQDRIINEVVADMRFAVMAERLGIDDNIMDILNQFPVSVVSVGTNDFTEDLLRDFFKPYGLPVSRHDEHFEARFFILEPMVLRKIIVLADKISEYNKCNPSKRVRLGVCGDLATRPEFALFTLWLAGKYQNTVDIYLSVPPGHVLQQKDFVRLVDPAKDFYVDGDTNLGSIFEPLLSTDHTHDLAIEQLAVNRVQAILRRGEQRLDYITEVVGPLMIYRSEFEESNMMDTGNPPSASAIQRAPQKIAGAVASSA
jgi:hypothetical protein